MTTHDSGGEGVTRAPRGRRRIRQVIRAHLVALPIVALGFGAWLALPPQAPVRAASSSSLERAAAPDLPDLQSFATRDGTRLGIRVYPTDNDTVAILLHGSGMDGRSLHALARDLGDHGVATAVVPDLRGHGPSPHRRGDVDHVGHLEDDLADLIDHLRAAPTSDGQRTRVVVIGHSLGGGLALRFGAGPYGHLADAIVLLAPFLGHDAPPTRRAGGGWAAPHVGRIAALTVLNGLGVHRFDGAAVIAFALTEDQRADGGTPTYSHRLQTSFAPSDYRRDLAALDQPLLVVAGRDDASFEADRYPATVRAWASADIIVLDGIDHVGVVTRPRALEAVRTWIAKTP